MTIRVNFILPDGATRSCAAAKGQALLNLAQANGFDLEGSCEGTLACATCHVVVDVAWYAKLPKPTKEEIEMLDLAKGRSRTSRLSCQIMLDDSLDGLTLRVPQQN